MAKSKSKTPRKRKPQFPIIGTYLDTPTKAKLDIIYFVDDIGHFKLSMKNLGEVVLSSCRIQFKTSNVKRKRKFFHTLKPFLDLSEGYKVYSPPPEMQQLPFIFGLLKLRKGKKRHFILITSAEQFTGSKVINILAVKIDNLLYLDLLNKLKTTGLTWA